MCHIFSDAIMHPDMNYPQAEGFLAGLTDYEKAPSVSYNAANYDLRRMLLLLETLANPQQGRRTIHIAGTKGKGSTAAMISSVLAAAEYRTGLFTSPHLHSWRERIAYNNRFISKRDFALFAGLLESAVISINSQAKFGKLTTFEVLTAMAFSYFKMKKTAFQVLETGMGGRLDATNVINSDICIITSISLDHTQILGGTLEEIALEKAGIIKPGCTVITVPQTAKVLSLLERKCRDAPVPLIVVGRDITWVRMCNDLNGQMFKLTGQMGDYVLNIPLLGEFQLENAALAVAAIEILIQKGVSIELADISEGLNKVRWPVRLQVLQQTPLIVADGAHNPYSIVKIRETIKKDFKFKKVFVIFGSSQDKDIGAMAKELHGFASHIITTSSNHPRAANINFISGVFEKAGHDVIRAHDISDALKQVLHLADENDLILVTGSLFLAAEAESALKLLFKGDTFI
jgi:dihydrofolate synthase/folylpolyglutamate synthase